MRFRWQARSLVGPALIALLFLSGCERVLGLDGLTDLPADAATGNAQDAGHDGGDAAVRDGSTGPGDANAAASDSGLEAGTTCSGDGDCASRHCADGVCCDTACAESCKQCSLTGYKGTCSPVAAGITPPASHRSCPVTAATACAENGKCDGNGGCAKWPNATVCGAGSCDATTNEFNGSTCNGQGTCQSGRTVTCAPFKCADTTSCASTCTTDSDCIGQPCVNGSCGKVANGTICTSGSRCASGNCVDGYCCDIACGGSCQACDVAGDQGNCTTVPSGPPHGSRAACAGSGTCQGACTRASTSCTYPTVTCAAASCSGGVALAASSCNGAGACSPQVSAPCNGFACNGMACYSTCSGNGMCAAATPYCVAGSCVSTLPLGTSCTGGAQCGTGNCVSSVCCSSASCPASDSCHTAGTCAAVTGQCSNPVAPDTTPCGMSKACSGGVCKCAAGFVVCGATCADLNTDPNNCGACGHSCMVSTTCSGGKCGWWLVAQAGGTSGFPAIASDGTNVVWADTASVREAPVGGGAAITLGTVPAGLSAPFAVALSGGVVAWTAWQQPPTAYDAMFAATEGIANSATTVATMPTQSAPYGGPSSIALSPTGGTGYFVDTSLGAIDTCSLSGVIASCSSLPPSLSEHQGGDDLALRAGTIFWTQLSGGSVWEMPIGGTIPVAVATGESGPALLALDATWVYWVNKPLGATQFTIDRNLQTNPTALTLAVVLPAVAGGVQGIATDGKYVYYGGTYGGGPKVGYVPVGGGVGQTLYAGAGSGAVVSVTVAGGAVYFYDSSDNKIRGVAAPP